MVEVVGERRTWVRRAAYCVEQSSEDPYVKDEPSARVIIQVFHDQCFKLEHMLSVSKRKLGFTDDLYWGWSISLMGGLGTLTNLNFHLLDSGQMNHVTSGPTVYGNMDRVVTIKWIQVGRLAYLVSQCSGGGLLSSRHRLVVLWLFLRIRLHNQECPRTA